MKENHIDLLSKAFAVLDDAYKEHSPSTIVGMFSGGHDSVCATYASMEWAKHRGVDHFVAHINTGIGLRDTRKYVYETAIKMGWDLKEFRPPVSYDDIVLEFGFPGPGVHPWMYRRLKERCVQVIVKETKKFWKDRVMLTTGVRTSESIRRMGSVKVVSRKGAQLWVAPIHDWSSKDKNIFIDGFEIPRNPVVKMIHMSGECLCGSYAKPGERELIRHKFPDDPINDQIDNLESKMREVGVTQSWGEPPKAEHNIQFLCTHCEKWS